jgi:FtsP/CotA-like multicopper oxidase with cupredoxin domain
MKCFAESRRNFLRAAGVAVGASLVSPKIAVGQKDSPTQQAASKSSPVQQSGKPDYTLRIGTAPIEIAPNHIISVTCYNSQFPGPLLRFKDGQKVTVDVYNDSDVPEQLHWHGQTVPTDVDGASEEGTPYIPAHG